MPALEYFCPAKINLLLAVTGRRADGFHDLVSIVAPLDLGDTLTAEPAASFTLTCSDPALAADDSNLVLKAARAFVRATDWKGGAKFRLEKRIPMGAGLGGGSSDAAGALRALNRLAGDALAPAQLASVAAEVGSDCALFLAGAPVVMRGRGEQVGALPPEAVTGLRGQRVLVFKPGFSIATPWAYQRLAADGSGYCPGPDAEAAVADWVRAVSAGGDWSHGLFNSLERPAFAKFVALPVLLGRLRARFGLEARMSGSGSACFVRVTDATPLSAVTAEIRRAWGESAWIADTRLA